MGQKDPYDARVYLVELVSERVLSETDKREEHAKHAEYGNCAGTDEQFRLLVPIQQDTEHTLPSVAAR